MVDLKARTLKSLKEKSLGLIGKKKPESIFFKTRFGIHTFGLRFPIDVLVLDDDNRVVKIGENLKPNRVFAWNVKFNRVIELPHGTIKDKKIKLGDRVK